MTNVRQLFRGYFAAISRLFRGYFAAMHGLNMGI